MRVAISIREPGLQSWLHIHLPEGASVREAIHASGLLRRHPALQGRTPRAGVAGRPVSLEAVLQAGDRIELCRTAAPASARRPGFALHD